MEKFAAKSIEIDGISEEFFNLLWMKDELNFGPSINIPDTVIFKYGQPVTWYFTASNGKIKKKNRNNLLNARIEDSFTQNILGYDVIATFFSVPTESEQNKKLNQNTIEYLSRKDLQAFLYDRAESNNGILQKFIEPKGTRNEMIRAIWSPKVCLLERAENIYQLHDHRYGLYERCVTYEGPELYITSAPLRGPVLAGQVQRVCEKVVSHISEVTFGQSQISRIVLHLKVDSRDKLWLMYTTSIRCLTPPTVFGVESQPNKSLVNIDNVLLLPKTVHLNPSKSYEHLTRKSQITCVSCGTDCLEDRRHPVPYKTIVKHYEHVLHLVMESASIDPTVILRWPPNAEIIDAAGGVGFGCLYLPNADDSLAKPRKMDLSRPLDTDELRIPPVLRYLHPKLTAKSYQRCKLDPLFLYKTVMVCENCFLVYSEFATMILRMGQDLTKLFASPDADYLSKNHMNTTQSTVRPSNEEWESLRKMTKSKVNRPFSPNKHHMDAKENAIGLRSSDLAVSQPFLPSVVRNETQSKQVLEALPNVSSKDSLAPSDITSVQRSFSANDIRDMVADRERQFFKEISKNPQLRDQHPLMHLITTQQKLAMIDEQSAVLTSKQSMHTESLFGSSYGKQSDDCFDKFGAYKEKIKFHRIDKIKKKPVSKKNFDKKSITAGVSTGESTSKGSLLTEVADMSESSRKHHEFLQETLNKVSAEATRKPFSGSLSTTQGSNEIQ